MLHPSSLARPGRATAVLLGLGCAVLLAAPGLAPAAASATAWTAQAAARSAPAAAARPGARDDAPRAVAAREDARTALRARTSLTAEDSLVATDTVLDADGDSHVRLERIHEGLEVVGGDVVVHQEGEVVSLSGAVPALTLSTTPRVAAARAASTATARIDGAGTAAEPELVVLARRAGDRLSWRVEVHGRRADGSPVGEDVFVDAVSGRVIQTLPTVLPETGSGHGVYSGVVDLDDRREDDGRYALTDDGRGRSRTLNGAGSGPARIFRDGDNVWGDGHRRDPQSAAVDVHWGTARTWDYYLQRHGRSGIGDDGVGARGIVHDGRYVNAYWDDACFCMRYGDGNARAGFGPLVSLDVVGHEMTHGVTSRTAGLIYRGEPGGLNEATSDILGTSVEFFADSAEDRGDYVIGEEIYLDRDPSRRFVRRMDKPSRDGHSQDCYTARTRRLDVHYSSGPANHFFYLLAEGSGRKRINGVLHSSPTCDGRAVRGIGREAAEDVWFRALSVYMVSRTGYAGARRATVHAAEDLYGVGSTRATRVRQAWRAVSVR